MYYKNGLQLLNTIQTKYYNDLMYSVHYYLASMPVYKIYNQQTLCVEKFFNTKYISILYV